MSIPDVIVAEPDIYSDDRGYFLESWQKKRFSDAGISNNFVQDNHSRSKRGVLRGLHYQVKEPQGKLVRVVRGEIFDVALDIRRESKTFGQWVGLVLSDQNKRILWVPEGFAHGFYTMSDVADVTYKCTHYYSPENERTIRWDDPELNIDWRNGAHLPLVSEKDQKGEVFRNAEYY